MSAIELVPAAPAANSDREIDFPAGGPVIPLARSHDRNDSFAASQIERTAEMSACGRFRWTLTRDWPGFGRPTSRGLVVMLNPSTADARLDDPTIRRLIDWHQRWGFGGFTVVNLLPLRSPNPDDALDWYGLAARADGPERKAFCHNLQLLGSAARAASQVLVGWGRLPADLLPLAREVLIDLEDEAGDVHCLGLTQAGFPIHPMARGKHRVPDDITPQRFDASAHP